MHKLVGGTPSQFRTCKAHISLAPLVAPRGVILVITLVCVVIAHLRGKRDEAEASVEVLDSVTGPVQLSRITA